MLLPTDLSPEVIWTVLLWFQSSKLLAYVGSTSWPLSSAVFSRQKWGEQLSFWRNKAISKQQPAWIACQSRLCHVPTVPCSSIYPCDFYFPCPLDLLLSFSIFFWSDLEADDSWVSLNRESRTSREVSVSFRNMEFAGAVPGLLSQARSVQSVLSACLILFQPQTAWSWASTPQLFPTALRVFSAWYSSVMFTCHIPTRLGTAMLILQQI